MKILVCFKVLPNWDKVLESDWEQFSLDTDISYAGSDYNCMDESALELALRIKEQASDRNEEAFCTAVTVGRRPSVPLTESIYAAGFDELVVLEDESSSFDPVIISSRLAGFAKERSFDLILSGTDSGMLGSGSVPFLLAERLGLSIFSDAREISLADEGIEIVQQDDKGLWLRCISLPALVSVGNSSAVLRAVNLRARLREKGRSPLIVQNSEPSILPSLAEKFSRSTVERRCKYLTDDDYSDLIKMLISAHSSSDSAATDEVAEFPSPPENLRIIAYNPSSSVVEISKDYNNRLPELTILPDNSDGRRLAAYLSTKYRTAIMCGVKLVDINNDSILISKKVCASNLDWEKSLYFPAVITLSGELPSAVRHLSLPRCNWDSQPLICERKLEAPPEDYLSGKTIVVICGVGVGAAGCKNARDLALRLGAGFGLTRPAALNGWGQMDEIVGQSGKSVSPSICLILGASGSGAFLAGIENAKLVVAVNTDKNALIFRHADIGIRTDAKALTEKLLNELENRG